MFFVMDTDNELVGVYDDLCTAREHSFTEDRIVLITNQLLASGAMIFRLHNDNIGLVGPDQSHVEALLDSDDDFDPDNLEPLYDLSDLPDIVLLIDEQQGEIDGLRDRVDSLEQQLASQGAYTMPAIELSDAQW